MSINASRSTRSGARAMISMATIPPIDKPAKRKARRCMGQHLIRQPRHRVMPRNRRAVHRAIRRESRDLRGVEPRIAHHPRQENKRQRHEASAAPSASVFSFGIGDIGIDRAESLQRSQSRNPILRSPGPSQRSR